MKAILAIFALLAGCALLQPDSKPAPAALGAGEVRSAAEAMKGLAIGKSTKAEVRAALGDATVVDFASGYEVWVYRQRREEDRKAPSGELALLFAPSGLLSKTRIREVN